MITRGLVAAALLATLVACGSSEQPRSTKPVGSPMIVPSQTPGTPKPPTPMQPSTPSQPVVPAAKDGQNYKACNDGTCEVLIRKKAALNLSGDKFTATAAAATLKLTDSHGYISLSRNGSDVSRSGGGSAGGVAGGIAAVSWSSQDGPLHIATLTYAEGDTVIVSFTSK
ncbi:hypothetical protein OHA18_09825 [Kribbella sp. NBC_00709]|uniref:hypothetical protein n=1 Tax=Kribbella sp. NBC_00709 TaxID=2975972 RepID=UPI002E2B88B3|nr:hypothetical protein [Kribbella sp. NBC_00709]